MRLSRLIYPWGMQGLREAAWIAALLLSLVAFGTTPAHAQDGDDADARARELYENGARLYDEGLYEDAIAAWKAAHDLSERPLLLYNIANAYERIGKYQEALDHLNRYRALAPSSERETLERRMRNIERRLEEEKANQPATTTTEPTDTGPSMTVTKTTPVRSTAGPHPAGIGLVVGGGVGLALGGVFGGLALRERASARALCTEVATGDPLCPSEAKAHTDADRQWSLGGDIAFIAGGAALGAGVIVLIASATQPDKQALRLTPSVGPGGAAVLLQGRF